MILDWSHVCSVPGVFLRNKNINILIYRQIGKNVFSQKVLRLRTNAGLNENLFEVQMVEIIIKVNWDQGTTPL
jgi:hypothetical protein